MGPFEGKDNGKTISLPIKMTKFTVAASKGDYNYGGTDNGITHLSLESFVVICEAPEIGVYVIVIGF